MGKDRIKIRYSLFNYKTRSTITGVIMVKGQSFHEISDSLTKHIQKRIPSLLKQDHPAEDPGEWNVLGFQDWSEWYKRAKRAKEAMNAVA